MRAQSRQSGGGVCVWEVGGGGVDWWGLGNFPISGTGPRKRGSTEAWVLCTLGINNPVWGVLDRSLGMQGSSKEKKLFNRKSRLSSSFPSLSSLVKVQLKADFKQNDGQCFIWQWTINALISKSFRKTHVLPRKMSRKNLMFLKQLNVQEVHFSVLSYKNTNKKVEKESSNWDTTEIQLCGWNITELVTGEFVQFKKFTNRNSASSMSVSSKSGLQVYQSCMFYIISPNTPNWACQLKSDLIMGHICLNRV